MRIFRRPHAMTAHGMTLALVVAMVTIGVQGNAHMIDPPARQMRTNPHWRILDCATGGATQLSQSGLSCGGAKTQAKNGGKCSACGDNYSAPYPRTHDLGGSIVRDLPFPRAYLQGQTLTVAVDITVAHKGAFEVRLCPLKEGTKGPDDLTQCYLDPEAHYVLRTPTGATSTAVTSTGMYYMEVMLPPAVNCPDGCNMQWRYRTGNTWGCDASGQCGQGFGDQLHFVNCADVRILNCQQYNAMTDYCKGASPQLAHCATMTSDPSDAEDDNTNQESDDSVSRKSEDGGDKMSGNTTSSTPTGPETDNSGANDANIEDDVDNDVKPIKHSNESKESKSEK